MVDAATAQTVVVGARGPGAPALPQRGILLPLRPRWHEAYSREAHEECLKREDPLQVAVSESDAADIVATINRALGVSNFRAA